MSGGVVSLHILMPQLSIISYSQAFKRMCHLCDNEGPKGASVTVSMGYTWGMQKESVSPHEHLTMSGEMPQVNWKEVSGPEGSMCLHPG